jgi:beta-glucosidase
LVDGLTNAGFTIDNELSSLYSTYVKAEKAKQPKKTFFEEFANPTPRVPELGIVQNLLEKKANEASVALITIGRNAGEGSDRKVENDFNLKASEVALVDAVSKAFHAKGKKVIVIINSGGVIEVSNWQDKADALLLSWQPGLEAGNAVADVLSGKVNPSGRLATTFPVKYSDVASSKNFPGKEFPGKEETGMLGMKVMPAEVTYNEGIYVGYRYFNSFGVKPAYAFGYGLSYTRFNYSALKLSSSTFAGKLTASVTVTNSGSVAGKEVVQLYITAPKGKLDKPSLELKAFTKTRVLQPGQSQTISFTINGSDLASFDTGRSAWIADAGKYSVKIGASSEDIKLAADFRVAKEIVTQRVNKALQPQVSINEEKPLVF